MASTSNPGGFMSSTAGPQRPREQKIKWTEEKDRELLLWARGRAIGGNDYQVIADSFVEKPSAKSVQVRLAKLKAEQLDLLQSSGILNGSQQGGEEQEEGEEGEEDASVSSPQKRAASGTSPNSADDEVSSPAKRRKTGGVGPSGSRFAPIVEALRGMGVPAVVLEEAHDETPLERTEEDEEAAKVLLDLAKQ